MLLKLTTAAAVFLLWAPVAQAWSWPVHGPVLQTFQYDEAHPYAAGQHRGIDIAAAADGDPVVAPATGSVTFAGTVPTSGKCVTIETPDGYSVTLTQLGSISVAKGASVVEGAIVGTVGPSGTPDFAVPYVHLGIRTTGDANGYVDPLGLLPALAPPPPATGGSISSTGAGAIGGSGSGASSSPDPTLAGTSSGPAPVAATPHGKPGGAGIVIRERSSAPAEQPAVPEADVRSATPKRPVHAERRPAETVSKPRRFDAVFDEPAVVGHAPVVPTRFVESSALVPYTLAAGPGIVAALAALAVAFCRRRRRPAAVVVSFPQELEIRRAA